MDPRFDQVRALLPTLGVDAIALIPGPNLDRLLGHSFHLMERPLVVVVDSQQERAIVPKIELSILQDTGFNGEYMVWRDEDGYQAAFDQLFADSSIKALGVEGMRMRVFESMAIQSANPSIHLSNQSLAIDALRQAKSDEEIAALRKAIQISESALEDVLATVKVGDTEKDIESRLVQALFAHGAEDLSFAPIVAAGGNSANPHASARADYAIQAGDPLLIDFGARYGHMHADITRTFFVANVSDKHRRFYNTVLAANRAGCTLDPHDLSCHDLNEATTQVLRDSEFSEHILHKTGHSLGRDVHETPHIMTGEHSPITEGMVFTVEPGLYIRDEIGVRIEDDIWVHEGELVSLTTFGRELRVVGA